MRIQRHVVTCFTIAFFVIGCADNPTNPEPVFYIYHWYGSWVPPQFSGLPFYGSGIEFEYGEDGLGDGSTAAGIRTESVSYHSQFSNFDISVDADGKLVGNGTWYLCNPMADILAQSPVEIQGQIYGHWDGAASFGLGVYRFSHGGVNYSIPWKVHFGKLERDPRFHPP